MLERVKPRMMRPYASLRYRRRSQLSRKHTLHRAGGVSWKGWTWDVQEEAEKAGEGLAKVDNANVVGGKRQIRPPKRYGD